jgi:hypothetical protein
MKLTAVSILKWNGEQEANLLGLSADLSSFGYFQRGSVKEMLIFVSRTVAKRTQPGQRQTVQNEEYYCHVHNRDGLVGIAFVDKDYPSRAAFSIVNKVLDDFAEASGNKWRTVREDTQDAVPLLDVAIQKYQVRIPLNDLYYTPVVTLLRKMHRITLSKQIRCGLGGSGGSCSGTQCLRKGQQTLELYLHALC